MNAHDAALKSAIQHGKEHLLSVLDTHGALTPALRAAAADHMRIPTHWTGTEIVNMALGSLHSHGHIVRDGDQYRRRA